MSKSHVNSHRAPGPVTTPLSVVGSLVAAGTTTAARRGAVVVATSGLVVAMGVPAQAAPETTDEARVSAPDFGIDNNAAFTVQASAKVSFAPEIIGAKAAPKAPERVTESSDRTAASRSADRSTSSAGSDGAGDSKDAGSGESDAPASKSAASVISIAKRYLGVPYKWGGTTPSGFDCSGFTSYVYKQVGINLPRTSGAQRGAGRQVSLSQARPGDLVWHSGHIGIYLGNGMKIHSPQTGDVVKIAKLASSDTTFIRVL